MLFGIYLSLKIKLKKKNENLNSNMVKMTSFKDGSQSEIKLL